MLDIERIVSHREKSSLTGLNEERQKQPRSAKRDPGNEVEPRWGKLTQFFSQGGKVTFCCRTQ